MMFHEPRVELLRRASKEEDEKKSCRIKQTGSATEKGLKCPQS